MYVFYLNTLLMYKFFNKIKLFNFVSYLFRNWLFILSSISFILYIHFCLFNVILCQKVLFKLNFKNKILLYSNFFVVH